MPDSRSNEPENRAVRLGDVIVDQEPVEGTPLLLVILIVKQAGDKNSLRDFRHPGVLNAEMIENQ